MRRRIALAAVVGVLAVSMSTPASATTRTVWQQNGLRVTYTRSKYIVGLFNFYNTTQHRLQFACSLDTKRGIGEFGRRLDAGAKTYYSGWVGGYFHWIGCAVSKTSWPRLPIQLAHEQWRNGRLEVEYYKHYVYFFNRVHTKTPVKTCSWTTYRRCRAARHPGSARI